jgi:hypothetical protein
MSLDDFIQDSDPDYNLEREDLTDEIPEDQSYTEYEPEQPVWVELTEGQVVENDMEDSTENTKLVVFSTKTGSILVETDYFTRVTDMQ